MNQEKKKIGELIKDKRKAERLSAEDLALKLGLKKENIYKWEKGSKPSDPEDYTKINAWLNNLENVPRGIEQGSDLRDNLNQNTLMQAVLNLTESNKILASNNERLVSILESNSGKTG